MDARDKQLILERIMRVKKKVQETCDELGREPPLIVGVTKGHPATIIDIALDGGITQLAENYVQEALSKLPSLKKAEKVHFIGHLQRNKVRDAFQFAHVIQSVDSVKLLKKIQHVSKSLEQRIEIYFQINFTREKTKHGLLPEEIDSLVEYYFNSLEEYPLVKFTGLMTIGMLGSEKETKKAFEQCFQTGQKIIREYGLPPKEFVFSYGMTNDYVLALQTGSTMLRLGTALFGEREKTKGKALN